MIIGVPKEIKEMENRVGATPAGVNELTRNGNQVLVEAGAELEAVLPMRLTVMPAQPLPTMCERYGVLKWFIR
ncbi:MAG: hypothetical protein CM15mP28_4570 [Pseudomonadota bacterium]|nr:MAG: hypothetical protein CM15mP28_4570 [Pseudomonadota bacterium]